MSASVTIIGTNASGLVPIQERDAGTPGIYRSHMLKDWLNQGLARREMSQAELARQLTGRLGRSYPRTAVNKMVLGNREIKGEEMLAIAEILNIEAPRAEGMVVDLPELTRNTDPLVQIFNAGIVEAGAFRAAPEFSDLEAEPVLEMRDPQFPFARLVAFDVAGDSMNRLQPRPILPGDRIIGVDFDDLGGRIPLRDGMVVVVEQSLEGGHLREWSVKQIELYEDRMEFHPRSTNPRHEPIVVPRNSDADDGKMVRILALVRRITNDVPF